jgi:hypothetical protein
LSKFADAGTFSGVLLGLGLVLGFADGATDVEVAEGDGEADGAAG